MPAENVAENDAGQNGLVIAGSGMAGHALVRQLRRRDSSLPITMVTADGGEMYSKPRLSVALAEGKRSRELVQMEGGAVAEKFGLSLRSHTRILGVNLQKKHLATNQGNIPFDTLVLALGASPVRLPIADQAPGRVFSVNSLEDYRRWREVLRPGIRVLLIGAGLIGCEFADDLITYGASVELVEPASWPLGRLLPRQLGESLASELAKRGARLHLNRTVAELRPEGNAVRVKLDNGRMLRVDLVLTSVGLQPNTPLALAAGLRVNRGIVVDRQLRTSHPQVYAIGDCAETPGGVLPFVMPLMAQATCLAGVLTGESCRLEYAAMPVTVKTSSLPLVILPPAPHEKGEWRIDGEGKNQAAIFSAPDGAPLGFALTGESTSQWRRLAKTMPSLLPA